MKTEEGSTMVDSYGDMNTHEPSEQIAGRLVGMVVFLAGIVMLVLPFVLAYQAFSNPALIVPATELGRTPAASPTTTVYIPALVRVVLLIVMAYIGWLIAGRGAQMFFTARREAQRGSAHD